MITTIKKTLVVTSVAALVIGTAMFSMSADAKASYSKVGVENLINSCELKGTSKAMIEVMIREDFPTTDMRGILKRSTEMATKYANIITGGKAICDEVTKQAYKKTKEEYSK